MGKRARAFCPELLIFPKPLERNPSLRFSAEDSERTQRDLDVVRARRSSALATITRIEAEIAKTRILAPFKDTVLRRHVEPGEGINAHTALATLADLNRVRIEAEIGRASCRERVSSPV